MTKMQNFLDFFLSLCGENKCSANKSEREIPRRNTWEIPGTTRSRRNSLSHRTYNFKDPSCYMAFKKHLIQKQIVTNCTEEDTY